MENKLKQGWVNKRIEEICRIIKDKGTSGQAPYLEIGNIDIFKKTYIFTNKPSVKGCKCAKKNDILISRVRPTRGAIVIVNEDELVVSSAFTILRNNRYNLTDKYLWFYLAWNQNFLNYLGDNCTGTMYPTVREKTIISYLIPLAPLNEQKHIVNKLDILLAKLKKCQIHLEKIPLFIKRFRYSVLATAFSGDLTKDWRDENEICKDWEQVELKEKCKRFQYGTSKKSQKSGDVPVLRMGNLQGGEIDWNDLVYTSDKKEIEKFMLDKNTVLFNRTNSPELVGKTSIFRGDRPAIFAGYLIRVETNDDLDPEYLNYYLNSCYADKWKYHVKTDGVSQSNINAKKLGGLNIPFPSIEEQKEIVLLVKILFDLADSIEERCFGAKNYIDNLGRSILNKAFRGELIPQENYAEKINEHCAMNDVDRINN